MTAQPELLWFTSSCGRIELQMTLDQAQRAFHQGECDRDVRELASDPAIAIQLAEIDPSNLAKELKDYGAWDEAELADHERNLQRILWLAAGEIVDEAEK